MNDHRSGACDYCDLPLPGARGSDTDGPRYCCYGCRFAADVSRESGNAGNVNRLLARLGLGIFLTLNVLVFTMVLWSADMYDLSADPHAHLMSLMYDVFRYLGLIFSIPVLWLLGGSLAEHAWGELRHGRPSTDLLLVLGVVAAFGYSAVSVFRGHGHVYFEVGCVILLTVTLGRWLEATGKLKATQALDALAKLLPEQVRLVCDRVETQIPLAQVAVGDVLHVMAGERIPADGKIRRGSASIDESIITGESYPIAREPGDPVIGGSHDLDGELFVEVTAGPEAGTLQRLVEAVRKARLAKGRYQQLADRVACWFMPVVTAVALATLVLHSYEHGFDQGLMTSLSVVLIACPCALALATPLAVWTALGEASRAQVLFASGEALERLAGVKTICLDKTGTITDSSVELTDCAADNLAQRSEVLGRAAVMAAGSSHPLAQALARALAVHEHPAPLAHRTLPGRGLSAEFAEAHGQSWLGSARLMDESALAWPPGLAAERDRWTAAGMPLVAIGWEGSVRGLFGFAERVRPEALGALEACRHLDLRLQVLTGDHAVRGRRMSEMLGVPVAAALLPEDKVAAIAAAKRLGPVGMVGDGINDAPALAAADVGIALGCGADVSRQTADVCLLGNDLRRVPWAVELARRTVRVIRQNLFWAFIYNILGMGLAACGLLNPILAALAMVLSSVLVVGNSLRLAHVIDENNSLSPPRPTSSSDESDSARHAPAEPVGA